LNPAQYLEPHWKDGGIKNPKAILAYVENYLWSTHQEYLGKRNSIIIEKGVLGEIFPTPDAYRALIRTVIEAKKYEEVTYLMLE